MQCVLLIPSWKSTDIYPKQTSANQASFQHPDGLLYIAGMLLKEGHDVKVIDGAFYKHEELINKVIDINPQYVGVYANTPLWNKAKKTVSDLKQKNEEFFIGVGGPFPIAERERCLKECLSLDYIDKGEGEYTTVEVINRLENKRNLDGVLGTAYRDKNGTIVSNNPRPLITNLDELPFPGIEVLENKEKYISPPGTYKRKPIINIHTSRGCVNACTFCFQISRNVDKDWERRIRLRSPENVVDEIENRINKFGYKEVRFLDDMFVISKKRVYDICNLIHEKKLKFTWFCSSRVDLVDYDVLKAMKKAGCWAILYGVESGVQKNLDTLKKNVKLDQIRNAVKWAKKAGIKVYTPFIFGIPGETYEDGLKSIDFALELDGYWVNFHAMSSFPGTELYETSKMNGNTSLNTDEATFEHINFIPDTLTKVEIAKLRRIAFKKFYGRPKYVLKRFLGIRNIEDIKTILLGARSFFYILWNKKIFHLEVNES